MQHATVIHLVQVDVSVDQLENSVHVNLVIQVLSVISVTQDIMDSLTAEVSYYLDMQSLFTAMDRITEIKVPIT